VVRARDGSAKVDSIEKGKEKREKRGRLSATADEAFGSPVLGEMDDDEMVVTISPHLAVALDKGEPLRPRPEAVDPIFRSFFFDANKRKAEAGTRTPLPPHTAQLVVSHRSECISITSQPAAA
jgi:hypothetical protein